MLKKNIKLLKKYWLVMYTLFFQKMSKLNYIGNPVVKVESNNWFVYKFILNHLL